MKISETQKNTMKLEYNEFYVNKAVDLLQKYFNLLDEKEYDEAFLFLKGKTSKYYHKERLNTFFKNNKSIVGHLEIFTTIYKLFHDVRMKLLKY
jgi:hypothetical protein